MFCIDCGTELPDEAKFCFRCGKPTVTTVTMPAQPQRTKQPAMGTSVAAEPGALERAVREAQAWDVLRLEAGDHRLSSPLCFDKGLSLIGEGMDKTRVLCDGEECVVKCTYLPRGLYRVSKFDFVAHDLTFQHEGSRWANVVVLAPYRPSPTGGVGETGMLKIDVRRCRFSGGVFDWDDEREPGGAGLVIRGDAYGCVAHCESVHNGSSGIEIRHSAAPTLERNTCSHNFYGISISDQALPELERNICRENRIYGIAYYNRAGGWARYNTCSENGESGIHIRSNETHPTLEANSCTANGEERKALRDKSPPSEPIYEPRYDRRTPDPYGYPIKLPEGTIPNRRDLEPYQPTTQPGKTWWEIQKEGGDVSGD
jgi:parallel beta-helix repeat protein